MEWLLFSVVILAVILILLVAFIWKKKKYKEPDYYGFFIIGLIWSVFGAVMTIIDNENIFFLLMGVVFLALGAANRKKWKKWAELGKKEKNYKLMLVGVLAAVVIAVLVAFILAS